MMPPRIRVEDVSSADNVSSKGAGSVTSWRSVSTLRVEEKEQSRISSHDEKKPSLKRWWSDATQISSSGPGTPNWKPLSMSTPILTAVIIASILMVAGIELLAQKSQRQGGLALSPSLKEIPQYAIITSQYVPQVLAVCYSLVWSWIDLDVKRMQPWFEMSKPGGATALNSLLLDYPYTFVAWVPFKAVKNKHWLVFLSGTAMVVVFWAITPLQSAQLGTGRVQRSEPIPVYQRGGLVPLQDQEPLLGVGIISLAYAVAWLGQPSPAFTTPSAAYLPFYVNDTIAPTSATKTNYTAETVRFSTELNCWPAEVSKTPGADENSMDFLNGQGCNTSVVLPSDRITMYYFGYYESPHHARSLGGQGDCPATENSTHQFLATWADVRGHYLDKEPIKFNVTGAYCQPRYFKQDVRITVDGMTFRPDEETLEILSPMEPLAANELNITALEFMLANGIEENEDENKHDYPDRNVVQPSLKITERNVAMPSSNMVAFALSQDKRNVSGFSNFEHMTQAFEKAHQFVFSFAISQLLRNETLTNLSSEAISSSYMSGIVVDRVISGVLEGLLLLICIFTGLVIWFIRKTSTNLDGNPSSIQRLGKICQNHPQILDIFCSISHADDERLGEAIKDDSFSLVWDEHGQHPVLYLEAAPKEERPSTFDGSGYYYEPVKPAALRLGSGIAFAVAVMGVIGSLIYLKWAETTFNGLKRPSQDQTVQQILENYIPTMISTLIQPFWVLVNRLLCVLRPFQDLWEGNAKSDRSISATYTAIPPQFAAWRALKSRHFILFLVCSTVFLANVLTISLPAIFQGEEVKGAYELSLAPEISSEFNNTAVFGFRQRIMDGRTQSGTFEEHKYSALANMNLGTDLLPWVSPEFFFQPWSPSVDGVKLRTDADSYVVPTRGYGVALNCESIDPFEVPLKETKPPSSPRKGNCGSPVALAGSNMRYTKNSSPENVGGPCAVEYLATLSAISDFESNYYCQKTLTFGWGRTANATVPENSTMEASMAVCRPIIQTAMFEVHVDLSGRVLSFKNTSEISTKMDYPQFEEQAAHLIANANLWVQGGVEGWHNSTLSNDWMNHFLVLETGSRNHLDPNEPVPDPKELIPPLDKVYRKLFALLLGLEYNYLFDTPSTDLTTQGIYHTAETRLFLEQTAFVTSMTMLSLNVIMAAVLYLGGTAIVLPRMPTTLGSLITYIAPSRMMEDLHFAREDLAERRFGFGRFIGRDGRAHVGIDLDTNVVKIEPNSIGKRGRTRVCPKPNGPGTTNRLKMAKTWL